MSSNFIYYVYAYIRSKQSSCGKFAAGTPYYIGKGKGDRAYNKKHNVTVPNDLSKIVFFETNLSNLGALALERRYIRWYGRKDLGTGCLRNLTDGGESTTGWVMPSSTKDKIRNKAKGRKSSQETKDKISKASSGENNGMYGKNHTQDTIDKLRCLPKEYAKGWKRGNANKGSLLRLDPRTLEILEIYSEPSSVKGFRIQGATEAAKVLGLYRGFIWKWELLSYDFRQISSTIQFRL